MIMYVELERSQKDVPCFEVVSHHLSGRAEETHGKLE
jgi:hypothetical protein